MAYYAFASVNLNLDNVQWPEKEGLQVAMFNLEGPCEEGGLLHQWPSYDLAVCDAYGVVSDYTVHMVVLLWVLSFQVSCERRVIGDR